VCVKPKGKQAIFTLNKNRRAMICLMEFFRVFRRFHGIPGPLHNRSPSLMNERRPLVPDPAPAARPLRQKTEGMSLFTAFPKLAGLLPRVSLGDLPTPLDRLDRLGNAVGLDRLYVKRDDLSADVYGGNKVRKLEFLLGDALRRQAKEVVTFGFAGSNHALATAIHARRLGLGSTSLLLPQPNAHYVRRNLLAGHCCQADLRHYDTWTRLTLGLIGKLLQGRIKQGAFPRVIPAGGSCPLGIVGYVNAAFELREQIAAGAMPEPDFIYVPLGSMGTSAGLAAGLKAAGLRSRIVAVRVIESRFAGREKLHRFICDTVTLLRNLEPSFPSVGVSDSELEIRDDGLGRGYACFTEQAVAAAALMRDQAGIILNGSYSAKAFATLLDDARSGRLKGKTVLLWNTYNSRSLAAMVAAVDYHELPRKFHRYFEEDVQPLDRAGFDR
jgi:1-aminocyclopropane-1-carboxylate deaminase/D-cysteine desulfhydrase-like pyridoxal-dependent ACC family enzyme